MFTLCEELVESSSKTKALCLSLIVHIAVGVTVTSLSLMSVPLVRFKLIPATAGTPDPVHNPQRIYAPIRRTRDVTPTSLNFTKVVQRKNPVSGGIEPSPPEPPPGNSEVRPPIVVESNLEPAVLIEQTKPVYPDLARRARVNGIVILEGVINDRGEVENLQVVSGHPMLVDAAIKAVENWKYRPAMLNGHFVPQSVRVQLRFVLEYSE